MFPGSKEKSKKDAEITKFAKTHYENFPVISFLIPREKRTEIAAIYWFARTADDLADEGNIPADQRLKGLSNFEKQFHLMLSANYETPYHKTLHMVIEKHKITTKYFTDLISAFRQDVVKKRYNNYPELLDYCRRSADPVGRLLLEIFGIHNKSAQKYSDDICTALQLTNFFQDTQIDYENGRIYYPVDEMEYFGVDEKPFELMQINDNLKKMVMFNIERTRNLFENGRNLLPFLKGRFRLEIDWTIRGGKAILERIEKNNFNVFLRPKLSKLNLTGILIKSLFSR